MQHPIRSERGFALLTALWFMILITGLTSTVLIPLRTARLQTVRLAEEAELRRAAQAGIHYLRAQLTRIVESDRELRYSGVSGGMAFLEEAQLAAATMKSNALGGACTYQVKVEDADSRLPLNRASEEELSGLLRAIGFGIADAVSAAQSILDWRDPDGLHRANGAEWDDTYRFQEIPKRPANGPLGSVDELQWIHGLENGEWERAAPFLTTYSSGRVNLNTASPPVLAALPGMTQETVRRILAMRRDGAYVSTLEQLAQNLTQPSRVALLDANHELRSRVSFEPRMLLVRSTGRRPGLDAPALTLEAVLVRTGNRLSISRVTWVVRS